jgi:hypothetical protein
MRPSAGSSDAAAWSGGLAWFLAKLALLAHMLTYPAVLLRVSCCDSLAPGVAMAASALRGTLTEA